MVRRDSWMLFVSSRVAYSQLSRTVYRWLLSNSTDGNSKTSLNKLYQC